MNISLILLLWQGLKSSRRKTKGEDQCAAYLIEFETSGRLHQDKPKDCFYLYRENRFGGQPYLVYDHKDAAHPHIYIVTTNIQPFGKRIDLHNLGRKVSEAARKNQNRF